MRQFMRVYESQTRGALSGFDRVRFRGTLRWLACVQGMANFLWQAHVLLKDFKAYAQDVTKRLAEATVRLAAESGRRVIYVPSCNANKDRLVDSVVAEQGRADGLICVLSCVESCFTYFIHRSRERKRLELRGGNGRCLHYYFYLQHPRFGRLHVRLQTWFPFNVHLCLNGRDWLARQLDAEGIGYRQRDNTFVAVDDVVRAQQLLDAQVKLNWMAELDGLLGSVHPSHAQAFDPASLSYYWSAEQMEWATDVMFRSPQALASIYPSLVRHAIHTYSSGDVMRFLGQWTTPRGQVHPAFQGEIVSDLLARPEGVRVKHRLNRNSLKMYDKQGSVLRVETTINDARGLKSYRATEGDPHGPKKWRPLRKGVADLPRLAALSQASNDRYLTAQAATRIITPLGDVAAPLCRRTQDKALRARALNPLAADDARLLKAVARGEFAISGFRNRDIRAALYGEAPADPLERKRQSTAVTRQLRMLRAHGLIKKVPHTHRYLLTANAQAVVPALLAAQQADTTTLAKLAG